jgi:RNA polymerase sigma factor (sigma-70 family)
MGERRLSGVLQRLRGLARAGAAEAADAELLRRFTARRDEAAFEALVRRHGPMVWGVCRRVLRGSHDAEDAFQAVFLVLVRKAASVARPELLGNWLYGVAYRTAREARAAAARRRIKEREAGAMPRDHSPEPESWRDALPLLDQELSRLPDKYRIAIVLCDLQGAGRRDAARRLGLPEGTLSSRLARGRVLLARRLAKYGLAVSGGALAAALAADAASAGVPPALAAATVRAAALFAAGGTVSAHAAALTEGVLKAMLWTKLKTAAALALAVGLLAAGAAATALRMNAARAEGPAPAARAPAAAAPGDKEPPAPADKADDDAADAVARGLKWLALHQAPDGHWSMDEFHKFAHMEPALDSKTSPDACTGEAITRNDVAGTAFGVLPFLGAGYTHQTPKEKQDPDYSKNVKAALDWLLMRQDKDGAFDAQSIYANALAATAVCEAYGITSDPALKAPAQKAVKYIVAAQDPNGGGWRYQPRAPGGDLSVTGFQLTALKSAQMAGLDVDKTTLKKAGIFLASCQTKDKGYSYLPDSPQTASMTAVGMLCRQYLGANPRDPALAAGADVLKAQPPDKTDNVYYQYYATLALFHLGGDAWKAWNEGADGKGGLRQTLLAKQSKDTDKKACENGSWDPEGTWKAAGGRLMQTSWSLRMLEASTGQLPLGRKDQGAPKERD